MTIDEIQRQFELNPPDSVVVEFPGEGSLVFMGNTDFALKALFATVKQAQEEGL